MASKTTVAVIVIHLVVVCICAETITITSTTTVRGLPIEADRMPVVEESEKASSETHAEAFVEFNSGQCHTFRGLAYRYAIGNRKWSDTRWPPQETAKSDVTVQQIKIIDSIADCKSHRDTRGQGIQFQNTTSFC